MPNNSITQIPASAVRPAEAPAQSRAGGKDGARTVEPSGKSLPAAAASEPADPAKLANAVSELNQYVQSIQRDLEFSVDDQSGRTIIKVVDSQSKEVIRQIPPEEVLNLVRKLELATDGTILQAKA